jgi:hypothetical protein
MLKDKIIPIFIAITFALALFNNASADDTNISEVGKNISEAFTFIPTYPNAIVPKKLIFEISPGESVEDYITSSNTGDLKRDFSLYATEPFINAKGNKEFFTEENRVGEKYKWINLEKSDVTLKPGEETIIKFIINIPENTELGDYELAASMETFKYATNMPGIKIATRILLPIEIKVTDDPKSIPKIKDLNKPIPTPYFYASIVIFLGCIGYFLYARRKEKRGRSKHGAHTKK